MIQDFMYKNTKKSIFCIFIKEKNDKKPLILWGKCPVFFKKRLYLIFAADIILKDLCVSLTFDESYYIINKKGA